MRIKREFAAEPEMVWEAWVDAEMLDRWWVPSSLRPERLRWISAPVAVDSTPWSVRKVWK